MSETPNKIEFRMLDHERLENDFVSFKLEDGTIVKVKVDLDRVGIAINFQILTAHHIMQSTLQSNYLLYQKTKNFQLKKNQLKENKVPLQTKCLVEF